ncbi:MAG: aldo/keto reductase [Coriobacteriia bacterium]|nr:aldo/keto reductase [Coriobacteriia bacterium]
MLYRALGTTGVDVSILGFGCMRLPIIDGRSEAIDYELATEMLHHAIDNGVNYIDTAYFYHATRMGQAGESEPFVGDALSGGWRDRVNLATKLPVGLCQTRDDMERMLEFQLGRLKTDHVDFYLLHGLDGAAWDRSRDAGAIAFLEDAIADGRVRFPAFSFHGAPDDFVRICDEYDGWAFAQIQYNYMDTEFQAGHAGLLHASGKGMGVVVMEPLRGGTLADKLPEPMRPVFADRPEGWTPAEWALRYVWNQPGVSTLLSGMSTLQQVEENIAVAADAFPGALTDDELGVFERAATALRGKMRADCTRCRYCMPCPFGVDIPDVIAALNTAAMWESANGWTTGYSRVEGKADKCTACGQCLEMCPQTLPIPDLMAEAVETFGG